jgi:hypothetical protein
MSNIETTILIKSDELLGKEIEAERDEIVRHLPQTD